MKKLALIVIASLLLGSAQAQQAPAAGSQIKFSAMDASPADILYFPLRAANVKAGDPSMPVIKIIYSRPQLKGREAFGVLEKFDAVWRVGANENTEITFNKDVMISGKTIKAGRYSMFAIPSKDKWTVILNSQLDRWGAYSYEQSKDVARFDVPVTTLAAPVDILSMTFLAKPEGANLVIAWDRTQVELPIVFSK